MNEMIKVEALNKSFGELRVLNDVSLSINKGEFVSIVGQSGAGKTTLLQIIGTLDRPDSGNVWIGESLFSVWMRTRFLRLEICILVLCFNFINFFPNFQQ